MLLINWLYNIDGILILIVLELVLVSFKLIGIKL